MQKKTYSNQINLQPRVVGTSNILKITASIETAGRYFCKASSSGFPEIRAEATVILKGPPKIISPNEQYPSNRDAENNFEIECTAISIPSANHVSWAYNGKLIDFDGDDGYSLRESYISNGIRSTLTIEENYIDYLGTYSCIVINSYGSDTLDILFREPSI